MQTPSSKAVHKLLAVLLLFSILLVCNGCPQGKKVTSLPGKLIAPAQLDPTPELWAILDSTGKEIVPPKFLAMKEISEGLAAVCTEEGWGYIDKNGKTVIPFQYAYAQSFSEGYAGVMENNGEVFPNPRIMYSES